MSRMLVSQLTAASSGPAAPSAAAASTLLALLPSFQYYSLYVAGLTSAQQFLAGLRAAQPDVEALLRGAEKEAGRSVAALLIAPARRLPNYGVLPCCVASHSSLAPPLPSHCWYFSAPPRCASLTWQASTWRRCCGGPRSRLQSARRSARPSALSTSSARFVTATPCMHAHASTSPPLHAHVRVSTRLAFTEAAFHRAPPTLPHPAAGGQPFACRSPEPRKGGGDGRDAELAARRTAAAHRRPRCTAPTVCERTRNQTRRAHAPRARHPWCTCACTCTGRYVSEGPLVELSLEGQRAGSARHAVLFNDILMLLTTRSSGPRQISEVIAQIMPSSARRPIQRAPHPAVPTGAALNVHR